MRDDPAPGEGLPGRVAVVTGAGSGIGRAIALALARAGAVVGVVGRSAPPLEELTRAAAGTGHWVVSADVSEDAGIERIAREVAARSERLDILVHAAGAYARGSMAETSLPDVDQVLRTNVRGPYALTRALLPHLRAARGQVVFVNSSAARRGAAGVAAYAASKHALRAIADGLRDEVNADGVRVLSIFPGRTATPLQAHIHDLEGRRYVPERLLQPDDVARMVLACLELPGTAEVTDLWIRPFEKLP